MYGRSQNSPFYGWTVGNPTANSGMPTPAIVLEKIKKLGSVSAGPELPQVLDYIESFWYCFFDENGNVITQMPAVCAMSWGAVNGLATSLETKKFLMQMKWATPTTIQEYNDFAQSSWTAPTTTNQQTAAQKAAAAQAAAAQKAAAQKAAAQKAAAQKKTGYGWVIPVGIIAALVYYSR